MPASRCLTPMLSLAVAILATAPASGQDYPSKVVRIVTTEPGGNADFNSRLTAEGLASALGQSVIVDNRPGTVAAPEAVAKAPPDGYTMLVIGSTFWLGPLLRKLSYDPIRDFSAVSVLVRSPNLLVVHPSLPVKSVKDLIVLAKARPGELNYASTGPGGSIHLASELFKSMTGVNIVHVPYKGTATGLIDLVGGQVQLSFTNAPGAAPYVKSGRMRAVAVTTAEPSVLFPDLPTVAATVPGYEAATIQGMFAPAKTPEAIIARLNREIAGVLNRADLKQRLLNVGAEAAPSSSDQFGQYVKSEISRMGKLIKDLGIRVE